MPSFATGFKLQPISCSEMENIRLKCTNCGLCQRECAFLQMYGSPIHIAESYKPGDRAHQGLSFECSLCGLCGAVCPVGIDPTLMFLEMRRRFVSEGAGGWPEHKGLIKYEKAGTSKRYTWYGLPENCDTVFFPGCSLPGTRPDTTYKLYEHMKKSIPELGIVLDCCTKPSHDLGREKVFYNMFSEMRNYLIENGIKTVLVACPNCYDVFKNYGGTLIVKTIYEAMTDTCLPESKNLFHVSVTIHDPCVLRHEATAHKAVRKLITNHGIQIREMDHSQDKALCCGEGGAVACISPELSHAWTELRRKEACGQRVITYCAGCTNFLGKEMPADHIADLVFEPEKTLNGKVKASRAPFTYLNRLKLKRRFKKNTPAATFRERLYISGEIS